MLKLGTVRFRAKCSRHPRYNPASDGEAAIRGGCPRCHLLLDIYRLHREMVALMQKVNQTAERRPSNAGPKPQEQLDLFGTATQESV